MSLVHVFVPKRHPAPPKHPRKPPREPCPGAYAALLLPAGPVAAGLGQRRFGLLEPQP